MELNGVETVASGDVRFTFRSDETDVNVIIEGKKAWVESIVDELGLSDVGLTMPIGVQLGSKEPDAMSEDGDEEDENVVDEEEDDDILAFNLWDLFVIACHCFHCVSF